MGYTVGGVNVMEFQTGQNPSPYEVLLGRDLICQGQLTMSFDGHFTFSI